MSTALVTISPSNVLEFKTIRLAALQDSPRAFGSTFAKEAALTDADWLARSKRWTSGIAIGYLAISDSQPVGLLLCPISEDDPQHAELISMWVAPTHRKLGVGRLLINAVVTWCRARNVETLMLHVTSSNADAIAFYERIGFTLTGRTAPYPNDPNLVKFEMHRPL